MYVVNTLNNLNVVQYDLSKLAEMVRIITGNVIAYNIFIRNYFKVLKSREGISRLLLSSSNPVGFLQTIALETNDFYKFQKIACIGSELSNEMNDIRNEIVPKKSIVTEQGYSDEICMIVQLWDETTIERKQRNENRIRIINTFRIIGLIGMYEQSAIDNYTTVQDIENRKKILNDYYEELIENDTTKIIIENMKNILDKVKIKTEKALEAKSQNLPNVVEIRLERAYSAKMISYEMYGEYIKNETQLNTFAEIITGLNRDKPAHALSGIIKVLEIK